MLSSITALSAGAFHADQDSFTQNSDRATTLPCGRPPQPFELQLLTQQITPTLNRGFYPSLFASHALI
ncbi:MAG: hypothetical protein ACFCU8_09930 [Thermosynechococcaceae cyanobacterium]